MVLTCQNFPKQVPSHLVYGVLNTPLKHWPLKHSLEHWRTRRSEVLCKNGVVKNFTEFTGKHQCLSLAFNKVTSWGLQLLKIDTLVNVFYCEVLKNNLFTEHIRWLLLKSSMKKKIALSFLKIFSDSLS